MVKKILLVDDDINLCALLAKYLSSFNFSIKSVHNTRNALVFIKEEKPDLVISDIMMQDLDGYDLIQLLRLDDRFAHIPVIFLSAKGMTIDRIKGYKLGCYAYVTKPFDPNELVAIIDSILSRIENNTKNFASYGENKNLYLHRNYDYYSTNLKLTKREISILDLLVKGYMNKEIAINLNISRRNVEKYVTRLLNKTHSRNRVELVKIFV